MGLGADLQANIHQFIKTSWTRKEGRVVPEPEAIGLGNDGVDLKEAACLYADLADSTVLVDTFSDLFAAIVYKSFLHCATKIILSEGGAITSFDGDRVMGIFVGPDRFNAAARTGLKISWAMSHVISPAIKANWPTESIVQSLQLSHTVGIDASKVFATRTGVRGNNDVVWVGRAPNYAAKLAAWREPRKPIWATETFFNGISGGVRDHEGKCIWFRGVRTMNGQGMYSCDFHMSMQ